MAKPVKVHSTRRTSSNPPAANALSSGKRRPALNRSIQVTVRGRRQMVRTPVLREVVRHLTGELFPGRVGAVCVHLVSSRQMARLNSQFLGHQGPTDVISFDHSTALPAGSTELWAELFVSPQVARTQAARYRVPWHQELARHVVHGLLHLTGATDIDPRGRTAMKKQEDRWLRRLERLFPLSRLSFRTTLSASSHRAPGRRRP